MLYFSKQILRHQKNRIFKSITQIYSYQKSNQ